MGLKDETKKLQKLQQNVVQYPGALPLRENQNGGIKANSLYNLGIILERDPVLLHTFAFNDFTHEIAVINDIPNLKMIQGRMIDAYDAAILRYIEESYRVLFPASLLKMAVTNEARRHIFNPVVDYFEWCYAQWDEKIRADKFLPVFLGAEESPVTTLETKLFFTGAVAKAYEPTIKFDYVLDLVGGQGAGKTTLLKKMGREWYTDQFTDFENKDNYSNMLRALIVNDDEMTATNNSSFEILKKFVSMEQLEFRSPYARSAEIYDKNFVMARTTNEVSYLKDKTGERRFMPILVNKERQKKHPVTDLNEEIVAQLWGEFVGYYKYNKVDFNLNSTQENVLNKHRQNFMYVDEVEEQIDEYLADFPGDFISSNQIAKSLGEKDLVKNRRLAKKIKYIMDNKPDWKYGITKIDGKTKRGYKKLH